MKTKTKTVTQKKTNKPTAPDWAKVRTMPVALFHSAGGPPIVGHVGTISKRGIVIWAPAHVTMTGPTAVAYLPIPFVDKYIELLWSGIRGTNPIDPIIVQGYAGYFDQFIVDAYRMKPLLMGVGVDAPKGTHEQPLPEKTEEKPSPLEACPACQQELSAWNAHHPVEIEQKVVGEGATSKAWVCEVTMPDVRTQYPDANPERPLHN